MVRGLTFPIGRGGGRLSALLGTISVLVALGAAIALTIQGWRAAARSDGPATIRLRTPVLVLLVAAVASLLVLEAALLGDDFSLEYVANHHAAATPLLYTVASAWGALEGSIVLWGVVLAGATWLVSRGYSRAPDRLGAGALAVMGLVATFFFALMATVADPFKVCVEAGPASCLAASPLPWAAAVAPPDGAGPNPLLQNHLLMAVHPPMLYLGYVGLTVPFAFAMAALALGPAWRWMAAVALAPRRWWRGAFSPSGSPLAAWWAYEVLSWGGYWAWDPVENASLLPWLMATAFLHSAVVQERRGMLQAWNFVLVIAAFSLDDPGYLPHPLWGGGVGPLVHPVGDRPRAARLPRRGALRLARVCSPPGRTWSPRRPASSLSPAGRAPSCSTTSCCPYSPSWCLWARSIPCWSRRFPGPKSGWVRRSSTGWPCRSLSVFC